MAALLDTGSSYIWFTDDSVSVRGINNHFSCDNSDTCSETDEVIVVVYGSGSAVGTLVQDNIEISGLLVEDQGFLLMSELNGFSSLYTDGLIGLGFATLSNGTPTLLDNLKDQGLIEYE